MRLFIRLLWPRSRRSLSAWTPLIAVGAISCAALSLALGIGFGYHAQQETALLRDGSRSMPPRTAQAEGTLRSTRVEATAYGPLVVTAFAGEAGQRLGLPGIPQVESGGTVMASPAVLAQLQDDWTGELNAWMGGRTAQTLPNEALAHPREMVIVEFMDAPPAGAESSFYPVAPGRAYFDDSSFIIMGIIILALPSVVLARAGAAMHIAIRSRRYGLLRTLGTPPRQMALVIGADMAVPMLAGALLGSAAYAAVMSSLGSFTLAGSSYWPGDLLLPVAYAGAVPLVTTAIGLASVVLIARRAGRDPIGVVRRDRPRGVSFLTYLSLVGLPAAAAAVIASGEVAESDFTLSVWLIMAGMLLGVVGLLGLTRLAVTIVGMAVVAWTRAQIAGSRMSRSGGDALLGVSATAVAVFLTLFTAFSTFDRPTPDVGTFDIAAWLDSSAMPLEPVAEAAAEYDGVTRVVYSSRVSAFVDGERKWVYTMTCEDVPGSVELDAPCAVGNIYLQEPAEADAVTVEAHLEVIGGYRTVDRGDGTMIELAERVPDPDETVSGIHPVGGTVTASWIPGDGSDAVLIVEQHPASATFGFALVTTDGDRDSIRRVIQGLRNMREVQSISTRQALTSGITPDTLVFIPYLALMATAAAGLGTVALLYAVLLLFRRRQAEFRLLRCQGATRKLLAADLGLLFAVPLVLAFGLAVAAGVGLAATLNAANDLPTQYGFSNVAPVLATMLAVGMAATVIVAVWATRIPPLVTDPDAAAA